MGRLILIGVLCCSAGVGAALAASKQASEDACLAFAEASGVPTEPCGCIAEAVAGDPDLQAEQMAIATMDDYENASDELLAAIAPCLE